MKKTIWIVIGITVAGISAYSIHRALRSDEDRIRELIETGVVGFNSSRAGPVLDALDESFHDEPSKLSRTDTHQLLAWLFLTQRDEATKEFRFRVAVSNVALSVDAPSSKASGTLKAEFSELRRGTFTPAWEIEVEAELVKKDGAWKVTSSRHKVISGKRPF